MIILFFWFCVFCSLYSYFLYPLLLLIGVKKYAKASVITNPRTDHLLNYSLIVTAYNEAQRIEEKIINLLALQFDPARLELIIASDCSDDGTDALVASFSDRGIVLVRAPQRLGKENAQWSAIQRATGDVLVFSDVATLMQVDAIEKLDRHFQRGDVGAVSSEDRFVGTPGAVAGEGFYVRYEMWLRRQESRLGGLVGLSGSFFAARRDLCRQWDIHSPSDFNTALNCARAGLQSISAPDVLGFYADLKDPSKEYTRKVRTVLRGMTGLSRHLEVLNVSRFGFYAVQVFSHKLMRWAVPWFLLALLLVSASLAGVGGFYRLALIGQILFYAMAGLAHLSERMRALAPIRLIYFFVQVNLALMDSALKFFSGTRMTTWKPSAR
ncbi:MAG: glycosyltransferase family 2 protein [Reinekea forsetii]|nr:glycosyltransferase family 2 protein [Reinekea forsetii]